MNYEEKYNELLNAVKKLQEANPSDEGIQNWVNENVPELKESEDERIKKGIIYGLKYLECELSWDFVGNVDILDAYDWLEKQGNTIPDECVFRPVAGCNIKSAAEQAIKQQGVLAKKVVLAFNGAYIPVGGKAADIIVNEYNSWLEKQKRQEEPQVYETEDGEVITYSESEGYKVKYNK